MPYVDSKMVAYVKQTGEAIRQRVYSVVGKLALVYYRTKEPARFADRFTGERHAGVVGQTWGELFDCAWFQITGVIPHEAAGKKVALLIDISGELLIVDTDGNPVRGMTTTRNPTPGNGKVEYPWSDAGVAGDTIDLWSDAGCNNLVGQHFGGIIRYADIALVNDVAKKLFYDWHVLTDLVEALPENTARRATLLHTLNRAANALMHFTPEEFARAEEIVQPLLAARSDNHSLTVSCICHAHMDLAWLWPIRETMRKGARTFVTVVRNTEKYPDYIFSASQAQLYVWVRDQYPTVFADVKKLVAAGRFEPTGGQWVEPDGNMPSGEAMARQFLYGKQFFKQEFGYDVEVVWLPDTFGFSAALPQIFRKAGMKYFTSARAFVNANERYHHTFWWEGLDGSRVLAHVLPEGEHYSSPGSPSAVAKIERDYMDKGVCDRALITVGMGDGGGGPGEEHLERLARERSLEGLPPVEQQLCVDFFRHIEKTSERYKTWVGELLLNICQGTFSSQARCKYYNRKMESALRELEFASACAIEKLPYPKADIDALWKETLLYQFHDILPGTAIERVHVEAVAGYKAMLIKTQDLTRRAYEACLSPSAGATAINSLSWDRAEWVQVDGKWGRAEVAAFASAPVVFNSISNQVLVANDTELSNDILKLTFNADGSIASVYDKQNDREVLSAAGNKLEVYVDFGDGWRIASNYREKGAERFVLTFCTSAIDGPVAVRTCEYKYGASTIKQQVRLSLGARRVDFVTHLDMGDQNVMVRASFPTSIKTHEASCETQFGYVRRPTHENTISDVSRFEVCAHRWADFSDKGYGVALLNDGKYGHCIQNRTLDLTLVRTTTYPGENADLGAHDFTYSLYPHAGDCTNGVIQEAYALNNPLWVLPLGNSGVIKPIVSTNKPNIIIDAIKKSEDGKAIIVRLYEAYGMETTSNVNASGARVELVNLIEEPTDDASLRPDAVLHFNPFEVHTLRVTP